MKNLKTDISVALKFNKTFRYIEDLLSINKCKFSNFVNEIYPPELKLKNTAVVQTETTYLDTNITIGKVRKELKD